jgi:hypothetical protein
MLSESPSTCTCAFSPPSRSFLIVVVKAGRYGHAHQDEANHLSNFAGRKKRQEQTMYPVALRLACRHAIDQNRQRPKLKEPTHTEIPMRATSVAIRTLLATKYDKARR